MVFKAGKGELLYGNSMYCTESYSCPPSKTMEFMIAEMHIEQSAYCDLDSLQLTFRSKFIKLCGGNSTSSTVTSTVISQDEHQYRTHHEYDIGEKEKSVWYPVDFNQVEIAFVSDASVNGDGFEIGFRCVSGETDDRPYPPLFNNDDNEEHKIAFHTSIANAVGEGFKALGHFFNFLTSVTQDD